MSHFDEMTCLLYLEGQLERPRAAELAAHAQGCAECRALLRALERESRLLAQALLEEDESVPARLLALPARDATPWAWIVSFGLAASGAYTLWTGIVEPWRQQLSQAGFGGGSLLTMLFFRGAFWKGWGDMLNAMQFLAILTLGILAFGLLRRTWRRWKTIALVLGALVAALALPPQAGAAEVKRHSHYYTLPAGEVVKNDLYVFTGTARIDGTVEGDLIIFCQNLTINGRVTGDVIAFSQFLRLNGAVDGNVRAFINTMSLNGTVGKNVMAFAQTLDLDSKGQVGGSLTAFVANGSLEGRVGRDLMLFIGRGQLNGFVGGNARLKGDRELTIGPNAEIQGKATFSGPSAPEVSPRAKLASPPEIRIQKHRPRYTTPRYYLKQALSWGAAFVFGLLLVLVMPGFFAEVVRASREYVAAPLLGVATLVGVPFLALVACITIVGLAVGIGGMLVWILAVYSAQVFVGTWLGERLMGAAASSGAVIGRLAVGLILLKVAGILPYAGPWVKLVVVLWGLGALTLAIYRRTRLLPTLAGSGQAPA